MTRRVGSDHGPKPYPSLRRGASGSPEGELEGEKPGSPLGDWLRPSVVELSDDGYLTPGWPDDPALPSELLTKPSPSLLRGFRDLRRKDDDAVRSFVARWGLLQPDGVWPDGRRECVSDWRAWSDSARAVLAFAEALHSGRGADDELREALVRTHRATGRNQLSLGMWHSQARWRDRNDSRNLALELNSWLSFARFVPVVSWSPDDDEPTFHLTPTSTFSAIALALAASAATKTISFGRPCAACGELFTRSRSSDKYCAEECQKRGWALASAKYRERRASQGASQTVLTMVDKPGRTAGKRPA